MSIKPPAPQPATFVHALGAGLTCGLLALVQSVGFGSLLVHDTPALSILAIAMALFSTVILAAITPVFSSATTVVAITQGISTVALAEVVGPLARSMAGQPGPNLVATAVVAIGISTLVTGTSALLLGVLRLGRFIRFAPFPVIGGFLAASGWLILRGGLDLIADRPIADAVAGILEDGSLAIRMSLAGCFILAILALGRFFHTRAVLPASVAAALILFNVAARSAGLSTETLRASGWLLMLPDGGIQWPPVAFADLSLVNWPAILNALKNLPSAVFLTIAAVLMNATGIELDARRDIDLDSELRSVGFANIVAGAGGGLPGFHSLTLTLLATRLGGRGFAVGLTIAAVCLGALQFAGPILTSIPTPLLGAILVWIGGGLLVEWLFRSYLRLSLWEYLIVILIFVVIAFAGFAWGLFVGVIAALMLFVIEYGRIDIVRLFVTGKDYQSNIDTSDERRQSLHLHGDAILILRLQGFLFFGTADRLRQRIERRVASELETKPRFIVIDFRRVTGLDSSTVLSFARLSQVAAREELSIIFTGVAEAIRVTMLRGGLDVSDDAPLRFIADIDTGLKWCEDMLLSAAQPDYAASAVRPLTARLASILNSAEIAIKVVAYCERLEMPATALIIEQGAPSNDIFFIEAGHASVAVASEGHAPVRLATVGPGSIVGEIAFYLGETRSASVVAEEDMIVWRLSRASVQRLQAEMPEVALRFHEGIAAMLAKRLTRTNHLVRLLAD